VYKTGIWQERDLDRLKTWLGTTRPLAYSLLNVSDATSDSEVQRFGHVIKTVRHSCGSFRTTYAGRLADLDEVVTALLRKTYPPDAPLSVHDWGASDAVASNEWAKVILAGWSRASFVASDRALCLIEARRSARKAFIFEADGTPLQCILAPFVVSLHHPEKPIYLANRCVSWWGRLTAKRLQRIIRNLSWGANLDSSERDVDGWKFRRISLVHPTARAFMDSCLRFQVRQHDAFNMLKEPCNVLRIMNLYNPRVFSQEKLANGFRAAFDSLTDGGFLILGQTREDGKPRNDVSIFGKTCSGFAVIDRLNSGSEVEKLVLSVVS
jgi:hypothetical protein